MRRLARVSDAGSGRWGQGPCGQGKVHRREDSQVVEKAPGEGKQQESQWCNTGMRGSPLAQPEFLTVLNVTGRVPTHHSLRASKREVDAVLRKLLPLLNELSEELGLPSIPRSHGSESACRWRSIASGASGSSANRSALSGSGSAFWPASSGGWLPPQGVCQNLQARAFGEGTPAFLCGGRCAVPSARRDR